jgi:hypothetical protein
MAQVGKIEIDHAGRGCDQSSDARMAAVMASPRLRGGRRFAGIIQNPSVPGLRLCTRQEMPVDQVGGTGFAADVQIVLETSSIIATISYASEGSRPAILRSMAQDGPWPRQPRGASVP